MSGGYYYFEGDFILECSVISAISSVSAIPPFLLASKLMFPRVSQSYIIYYYNVSRNAVY